MSKFDEPPGSFVLPEADEHLVPVSGGADSTVLALYLRKHFPQVAFTYLFCDTKAEPDELYASLARLEDALGQKIIRLHSDRGGLYELIEEQGGFLPSSQARWCTRLTKSAPLASWLKASPMRRTMSVGIRADERTRLGLSLPDVETVFPFIRLGWSRSDVFDALRATIGIPAFYRFRSRSGCAPCPFQRRSEFAGLLENSPAEFEQALGYEKLSPADNLRHASAPSLSVDTGWAANHFSLPLPEQPFVSGRAQRGDDLFGSRGIFLAAEFFTAVYPGYAPFTWWQRLVSFSTTSSGIQRQVDMRFQHLRDTREAWDLDEADLTNVRYAIYYIEAPAEVFDPDAPGLGSFTWQSGVGLKQLRHVMTWAGRVLHAHSLIQDAASVGTHASELTWSAEHARESELAMRRAQESSSPLGRVVNMGLYAPREPKLDDELDERHVTCPACSI